MIECVRVIDIIERKDIHFGSYIFIMAKELGVKSVNGIEIYYEFSSLMENGERVGFGFEPKANAIISAYISNFGLDKEIFRVSKLESGLLLLESIGYKWNCDEWVSV